MNRSSAILLETREVTKQFGGVIALDKVSFQLPAGMRIGIIGPNGAGKTSLLNALSRLVEIDTGDLLIRGKSYRHAKPNQLVALGIARSFQHVRNWHNMDIRDNVLTAGREKWRETLWTGLFRRGQINKAEENLWNRACELFRYFNLETEILSDGGRYRLASELSIGQQRVLELVRVFLLDTDVLLLDEPSVGLSSETCERLSEYLFHQVLNGKGVIIVSHDLPFLHENVDKLIVMSEGRIIAYGDPMDVIGKSQVKEAYLDGA